MRTDVVKPCKDFVHTHTPRVEATSARTFLKYEYVIFKVFASVETILDCVRLHLLQGHSSFRSHRAPTYLVINTGYTSDLRYEFECSVQLASPIISPKNILERHMRRELRKKQCGTGVPSVGETRH